MVILQSLLQLPFGKRKSHSDPHEQCSLIHKWQLRQNFFFLIQKFMFSVDERTVRALLWLERIYDRE